MRSLPSSWEENRPLVIGLAKELEPARILDIGVGGGYYGEPLRDAFGPDVVIDGVEVCEELRNPMWEAYDRVDIRNVLVSPPSGYDLYLLVDVVEHWFEEDVVPFLAALDAPYIISTPIDYPQADDPDLPWQGHVSFWHPGELPGIDHSTARSVIVVGGIEE